MDFAGDITTQEQWEDRVRYSLSKCLERADAPWMFACSAPFLVRAFP